MIVFQGGRDSPSLGRSMQNDDGWNQVQSKGGRSTQPVDPSRLKITKVRGIYRPVNIAPFLVKSILDCHVNIVTDNAHTMQCLPKALGTPIHF